MRLSETIIIYLAAGAPFGAFHFLSRRKRGGRLSPLLRALRAALLWPFFAAGILYQRRGKALYNPAARLSAQFFQRVTQSQAKLLGALYKICELAEASASAGTESTEALRASRAVREGVEKYVELTIAAAETHSGEPPSERETELFRVAGRRGEDLLTAGHCLRRRNAARLVTHQARSRTELLHALAEVREVVCVEAARMSPACARHLSVATLRFYGHALDLLSLLEDEDAALSVARLIDAECMRLRRLETLNLKDGQNREEGLCSTHVPHSAFTGPSLLRASNPGSTGC